MASALGVSIRTAPYQSAHTPELPGRLPLPTRQPGPHTCGTGRRAVRRKPNHFPELVSSRVPCATAAEAEAQWMVRVWGGRSWMG